MNPTLSAIATIGAVFLFARSAASQDADENRVRLSESQAGKLLSELYHGKESKRDEARSKLLRVREEDKDHLIQAFEDGIFTPPRGHAKERVISLQLPFEGGERESGLVVIRLPKKYNGRKPFPLIFRFHGTGMRAERFASWWDNCPQKKDMIAVTPEIPTDERAGWANNGAKCFFDAIYRHMVSNYNVDTDRVYFSGFSAGGAAAFYYTQSWPQLCAGFFATCRLWWNYDSRRDDCMAVSRYVPGFFVVGLKDIEERIDGFRQAEAYYREHDYDAEFHYLKHLAHDFYPEDIERDAMAFLLKKTRVKYPTEFAGFYYHYRGAESEEPFNTEQYWLKALEYDPRGTAATVAVSGNHIWIKSPSLRRARLVLNDEIVDLDQPVRVTLNGDLVFDAKVDRSVEFLLDWFEKRRDPKRLFWNQIEVSADP